MKTFFKILFVCIIMTCAANIFAQSVTIKLDTAGVYPYPTRYDFCAGDVDSVYLIQPTIPGMTGVRWYIPNYPVQVVYDDTVLIVPLYEGTVQMNSNEGYMREIGIWFYSAPPAHADFSVFSGGNINSTNDTVWMCGTSVSVLSNTIGSEATSYTWTGPGGFVNSSDDPVILTAPGTYYFARQNPCGTTTDTVVVVQLPTSVPVWTDTVFCNVSVNLTLDPGPGWNYSWNTGATSQSITVTDTGFYKVNLTNACMTDSAWIHVTQQTYPLPDLMGYVGTPLCHSASLTLDPNPSYVYDSYQWNTGAHTSTITVSGPTAVYTVTVSKGACLSFASAPIEFYALPDPPSISIATVDEVSGFNKVVFHPTTSPTSNVIDKYNIYKLSGTYTLLGSVSPDAPTMTFIDSTSNPMISATRYKVSAVDTCGDESELSYGHGTIKINSNPGTGGVIDLTIVDSYWDESGQYSPSKYYILIDSLNDGNLAVMDSMDAVYHSYTVTQPVAGATYLIGVAFPWARVYGLYGTKTLVLDQMSISNKSAVVSGINDYDSDIAVSIYPNPSTGVFTVNGEGVLKIVVTDLAGRVLQTYTTTSTIDLSGFAAGIYNAKISNSQGSTNRQLVISR